MGNQIVPANAARTERRRTATEKYTLIRCDVDGGIGLTIETSEGGRFTYPCISYCESEVNELKERMARTDPSPMHFGDIVGDFITELYYKRLCMNGL